jgi:cytochrome c biogenesis protein CcmG/thiol:disulfide interchange protein DsbE
MSQMGEPAWRARVRGSRLGNLIVIGVTALAVAFGAWLVMRPDASEDAGGGAVSQVEVAGAGAAPVAGAHAPDFTATTLDGEQVSMAALQGRPVWLLFVATWCSGCRAEMPDVQAAHQAQVPDGVEVVAVYVGEDQSVVQGYAERLGLNFDQVPDTQSSLSAGYGVRGIPAHFFIDADGVVQHTWVGVLSPDQIEEGLSTIT